MRTLLRFRFPAPPGAMVAVVLLAVAACDSSPTGPGAPITELPRPLSTVERKVLGASNAFAFRLARELLPAGASENLFYSPLSASMVLGMLLNGADGGTREQIRSVLALDGLGQEEINEAYRDLTALLLSLDASVEVAVGNSVWAKQGFPVMPDFLERVRSAFGAEAATVDFGDPSTLARINNWARDATRGRIEEIFEQLPANVVMVLLNAIYFKADWTQAFDRSRTERAPFQRRDGTAVTSDLMYLEGEVRLGHAPGVSLVELTYGRQAFSMVAALPESGSAVEELVRGLTPEVWERWMGSLASQRGTVRLPRFEVEWEAELNEALQNLGMTDAFDAGAADFRRLTPGGGVWLDLVKQKAFVRVDEEGTEAAAVTGAVMRDSAPAEVRFDRPFLFALRERLSGAILFLGVVNDPAG